jgi:translation initiation factor 4G
LLKKFRGILNKLTPQKYDDLLKQIMLLKVDTEDRLKRVLDLIFEKAVDEPAFCLQYANLCKHIANFKVNVNKGDNSSEEVKFQKLLLSKCQKEFEADVYASIEDLKERKQEVEECTDAAKKKALFEILDDDMRRARKRSLGNIKLIGELYKLHMLRGNIMLQCIENLCNEKDDESLECLCALLKTIGEQIEEEAATKTSKTNYTAVLDSFFVKMDKIANQQCSDVIASPRVRFMLRDVIDMRKNNWKARRDENLPKMIDEIHQEAKKEDEQRAQDLRQHEDQKRKDDKSKRGLHLFDFTFNSVDFLHLISFL